MPTRPVETRPAAAEDGPAIARTRARALPRYALERTWVADGPPPAAAKPYHWVAVVDGEVVGVASHSKPGGKRVVATVHVDPNARGRGAGTALARRLLEALTATSHTEALLSVDDHDPASVRFARGFGAVAGPVRCNHYDLDVASVGAWDIRFGAAPVGVGVRRLGPDDATDESLLDELFRLHLEAESEPYLDESVTGERDDWVEATRRRITGDGVIVVAERDGRIVGVSTATLCMHVPVARTSLTYVPAADRGCAIGTALKAAVCRWAHEAGVVTLFSEVHEDNGAIHRANEKLGFEARPSARWTLPLAPPEPEG